MLKVIIRVVVAATMLLVAQPARADHRDFDKLLKTYVRRGRVDYEGIRTRGKAALDKYVAWIGAASPGTGPKALAFYINAYNALVIKAVVQRYPISSVMKVPGFFDKLKFRVAGLEMSLNHLEKKLIMRKFQDPRVHFALVCAARGCPPLRSRAFFGASLDTVLDRLTTDFINSPGGVRVRGNKITVSRLFEWYAKDFGDKKGSVNAYLARYHRTHADRLRSARLGYHAYNWALNKQ